MKEHNPQHFIEGLSKDIPALSTNSPSKEKPDSPSIISGVATGAITYLAAPDALGAPREGNLDEISAAAVAAFTYFASRIEAPHLCSTKGEQQDIEKWNIVKGGAAGVLAAIPIAIKVAADVVFTVGILILMGSIGAAGVWFYNRLNKVRYCRHCQHTASCDQVVCRNPSCLKLYFPMEKPLRCDESISLTWYALASQLHNDGLNYFEAYNLVEKHFHEWVPHPDGQGKASTIECKSFSTWRDANMSVIASFRGTVSSLDKIDIQHLEPIESELKQGMIRKDLKK